MTTVFLIMAAGFLTQGDTAAGDAEQTYRIVVTERSASRSGESRTVFGVILTAVPALDKEADSRVITVRHDEPWEPKPKVETLREGTGGNVSSIRPEPAADRERRIRKEFEAREFTLVGDEYWNPLHWIPKQEAALAERARDMALQAEAEAAEALEVASLEMPAEESPAASKLPVVYRIAQFLVGIVAVVVAFIVGKAFFV